MLLLGHGAGVTRRPAQQPEQAEGKAGPSGALAVKGRSWSPAQVCQAGWGCSHHTHVRLSLGRRLSEASTFTGLCQRRPRYVCRPEVKQMTYRKSRIFSTVFICQKNKLCEHKGLLTGKDENSLLPIFFSGKKVLWRLMNNEPQLTMSGRPCSWLYAHNGMDRN